MKVDIQFEDSLMSDEQAETFAYNVYRDIAEYIKNNFDDFIWWNLEEISICCIMTIDGIVCRKNRYSYDLCKYQNK